MAHGCLPLVVLYLSTRELEEVLDMAVRGGSRPSNGCKSKSKITWSNVYPDLIMSTSNQSNLYFRKCNHNPINPILKKIQCPSKYSIFRDAAACYRGCGALRVRAAQGDATISASLAYPIFDELMSMSVQTARSSAAVEID